MKDCTPFREMLEAHALGALDPVDRETLEVHLATGCSDCTRGLSEARALVSQLAYIAPEATPSDMLKGRLMQIVRAESASARTVPSTAKSAVPFWLWAGVAALLVLSLYSSWNARHLQNEVRELNERTAAALRERATIEQELETAKHEALILSDPATSTIALASSNSQMPPLEAKWHAQMGIVVTGQKVPMPAGDRVLQLWLIPKTPGGKPIPCLTLRPDEHGNFILMVTDPPQLMADTKALAISEEPSGGSAQPTTTPIWVGGVS
ncbi:MAG: anti-sigma factor [Candidatus Acidiferrum sp.]